VDAGAQLGYIAGFAAEAIGPQGTALLYEPDPRAADRLAKSLASAQGRPAPRAELRRAACSNAPGESAFQVAGTLGHSSVVSLGTPEGEGEARRVVVETVVLDDELEARGVERVRLLKIDVEGHEIPLLEGLERTLAAGRIDYAVVEKHSALLAGRGLAPRHLHAMFARHGFAGAHERPGVPITRASLEPGAEPGLENLFYARTGELLREAFPGLPADGAGDGFAPEELETLAGEAAALFVVFHPASRGDLGTARREAERLLAEKPGLHDVRGHLAFWHSLDGDKARAAEHCRVLIRDRPGDAGAQRLLDSLEAEARTSGA
jgi:FkbM family methyltransferase